MESDYEVFSQYIQEKQDYVDSVIERLGWKKEYIVENASNMSQCPLDPGHWMPESSLQDHIVKCRLSKAGMDFSAYECPVDTSYCYKDASRVVQVHVDDACWKAVSAEVAQMKMQKEWVPSSYVPLRLNRCNLVSSTVPLLATNREEVGPTAVWLDGATSGVQGGEGYSAYVGRWVGQDGSSTSGDAVVMRGEKLGRNEVKMVPVTTEGPGTLEQAAPSLETTPVPAEYDIVTRSVDERRVMYEQVIAVSKPLLMSSAAEASADQELLSYDFDKEVRRLKRAVEEDDSGQQKTYLQKLAEQRDEKRRRQKYKSKKVYASNKSIKEIYKAIIDKRMAEFGEHPSLQHPSHDEQHQQTSSSRHQRVSGSHYKRQCSSEQGEPQLEEVGDGEKARYEATGPQSQKKDNSGCTEPGRGDDSEKGLCFSIEDQSDFDYVQGSKTDEVKKRRPAEDAEDDDRHYTSRRRKHKRGTRAHSHQRDSGRHKRKKRSYSKDRHSSGPSSSKKRKEERRRSSGRREVETGRVERGNDGRAGGDRVGKHDGSADDGTVRRGDNGKGDDGRVEGDDDGLSDGEVVSSSDDDKGRDRTVDHDSR